MVKQDLKTQAVKLRKKNYTYSEILKTVPVAKSTLSLWFKSEGISIPQVQRSTAKRLLGSRKGGLSRHNTRLEQEKEIFRRAAKEIGTISNRDVFMFGIALYLGEGSKAKIHNPSVGLIFTNADPSVIKLYINWLKTCLLIRDTDIDFELYIHQIFSQKVNAIIKFWAEHTGFPVVCFNKTYFKKNIINTRKNKYTQDRDYWGTLRVKVKGSTNLNRKVFGYIEEFKKQCGVV